MLSDTEKKINYNNITILKTILRNLLKIDINLNHNYVDISFKENENVVVIYQYRCNEEQNEFFKKEHFLEEILSSTFKIYSTTRTREYSGEMTVINEYNREYKYENKDNLKYDIFLLNFIKKINDILFSPNNKHNFSLMIKNPNDFLDDLINFEKIKNGAHKVIYFETIGMKEKEKDLIFGLKEKTLELKEVWIKERKNNKLNHTIDYGLSL